MKGKPLQDKSKERKSPRVGLWESQSEIQVGKPTTWIRSWVQSVPPE